MHLPSSDIQRVLVTGATGFLGFRVVAALLEAKLSVSVLVHQDQSDKLVSLGGRVNVIYADIWNRPSLKGHARGHQVIVHLVGSLKANPAKGLTYQQINLVSARNVVGMGISDGVPHFILLSVAALPGMLPHDYVRSKRDAEEYLQNSGLHWTIVRPSSLYVPSVRRPLLQVMSIFGILPPFRWFLGRYMPLTVDTAARGIAGIVQEQHEQEGRFVYATDLRRLASRHAPKTPLRFRPVIIQPKQAYDALEEVPFGWLPPTPRRRR